MADISELALEAAKMIKEKPERIKFLYIPLQLIYCEFVKSKQIPALSELPECEKLKYWKVSEGEGKVYKRIWIAQAAYVFNLEYPDVL